MTTSVTIKESKATLQPPILWQSSKVIIETPSWLLSSFSRSDHSGAVLHLYTTDLFNSSWGKVSFRDMVNHAYQAGFTLSGGEKLNHLRKLQFQLFIYFVLFRGKIWLWLFHTNNSIGFYLFALKLLSWFDKFWRHGIIFYDFLFLCR